MTYLKRTSEKKHKTKRNLLVFSIILLIFVSGFWFRRPIGILIHKSLYPINLGTNYLLKPIKSIPVYFSSKKNLTEINKQLEDENKRLNIESLSVKKLKDENSELKNILNIKQEHTEQNILAEVVLTPPFSPYDRLVARIMKSSNENNDPQDDIKVGNHVFLKNILVGEVIEIFEKNIIVKLYSNYEESLPVKINNEIIAEAKGQGGLSFKIEIPKDLEINDGWPIYLMEYPEIAIGLVEKIKTTEASSFQTIYFNYPFDFSDFGFIEIRL